MIRITTKKLLKFHFMFAFRLRTKSVVKVRKLMLEFAYALVAGEKKFYVVFVLLLCRNFTTLFFILLNIEIFLFGISI
jgi:hypothetical protein